MLLHVLGPFCTCQVPFLFLTYVVMQPGALAETDAMQFKLFSHLTH
jgi:hypothetical protein